MSPADHTLDRIRNSDPPFRYVADPDQRDWTVRSVPEPQVSRNRRSSGRLAFISDDEIRWVDDAPDNWMTLDDDSLFALTLGARQSR